MKKGKVTRRLTAGIWTDHLGRTKIQKGRTTKKIEKNRYSQLNLSRKVDSLTSEKRVKTGRHRMIARNLGKGSEKKKRHCSDRHFIWSEAYECQRKGEKRIQ